MCVLLFAVAYYTKVGFRGTRIDRTALPICIWVIWMAISVIRDGGTALRMSADGLHYRAFSRATIPWTAIESIDLKDDLRVRLINPADFPGGNPIQRFFLWIAKPGSTMTDKLRDYYAIKIQTIGFDGDLSAIERQCQAFMAEARS